MFRIFFSNHTFIRHHTLLYNFRWTKKVVNIRAQPQILTNSINTSKSDDKNDQNTQTKSKEERLSKWEEKKHFESLIPSKITNKSYNLNAQAHLINKSIKNLTTLHQLFKLHNKYKNRLSVNQYLRVFQKLAYIEHFGQENQSQKLKNVGITQTMLIENYSSILDGLKKSLFSSSHAPEIYITFIYTLSKCHNQFMYSKGFEDIFIKIIKNQLLAPSKQQRKSKVHVKSGKVWKQNVDTEMQQREEEQEKEKEQNYVSTSQVISILNNYKLAQSLLRILNHRTGDYKDQNVKLMLSLLREVITFLHTPSTPNQITNQFLFELVYQYILIYPHLKLPNGVLKSLIRQCLARIKYEDILKKIQNKKKLSKENQLRLQQITIVNSLKKLLLLQNLLIQQTKVSALRKQILETKPNNLQFSSFYKIQHKVHKYIAELLPRCKIYSEKAQLIHRQEPEEQQELTPHGPLWQHTHLVPMLKNHVKLMMIETPIDILSKSDLLMSTYDEFEAIISYLLNIYSYSVEINKNNSLEVRKRKNFSTILTQSYNLLYILMRNQLQLRIPAAIVAKCMNGKLMTSLIGDFNYLTVELKIFVLSYLLNNKNMPNKVNTDKSQVNANLRVDNNLILELITSLLKPDKDMQGQFKRANKTATGCWYVRLLAANPQYLSFINAEMKEREQQMAFYCFQGVIQDIQEYLNQELYLVEGGLKRNEDISLALKKLGGKIGVHLRNMENKEGFNRLLEIYRKESSRNSIYTERQFKQLEQNMDKYETKISGWGARLRLQQKRRQKHNKKINISYSRVELMGYASEQYFGQREDEKRQGKKKIIHIYQKQRQFLFTGFENMNEESSRKSKIEQLFGLVIGTTEQEIVKKQD